MTRAITRGLRAAWQRTGPYSVVLLVAFVTFAVTVVDLRSGHDWGDDFSLYINQAKAITHGGIHHVIDTNAYTLRHSSWDSFSPKIYPWGFPLLLSPVYAIFGLDYHAFKIFEAACLAVFVACFGMLLVPRIGRFASVLVVLVVACGTAYVGAADTVLSDLPYLAFVGLSLLALDRAARAGLVTAASGRLLVTVGLLAGFSFMIRREGIALFLAIAAMQLAALAVARGRLQGFPWRRIALPYVAAAALVGGAELVLYSNFGQHYVGTGPGQIRGNLPWFHDVLAELVGLKDPGVTHLELGGSMLFARIVFAVFLFAAVVGLVVRMRRAPQLDVGIAVYTLGAWLILAMLPSFHDTRYMLTIIPFVVYFAYVGMVEITRGILGISRETHDAILPVVVACTFVGMLASANATDLWHRIDYRLTYGDYTVWGPEDPRAQEMFAAVRRIVPAHDVVGFFRARAMNLYTDRQALQLTQIAHVVERADWYVMEKDSTYSQVLLTDEEAAQNGLTKRWENDKFVLWRVTRRPSASASEP